MPESPAKKHASDEGARFRKGTLICLCLLVIALAVDCALSFFTWREARRTADETRRMREVQEQIFAAENALRVTITDVAASADGIRVTIENAGASAATDVCLTIDLQHYDFNHPQGVGITASELTTTCRENVAPEAVEGGKTLTLVAPLDRAAIAAIGYTPVEALLVPAPLTRRCNALQPVNLSIAFKDALSTDRRISHMARLCAPPNYTAR